MADDSILDRTRRAVLKSAAAALGVGGAGAASGHPGLFGREKGGVSPEGDWRIENDADESALGHAAAVGYHSMGGEGPASEAGRPEQVYDGTVSELEAVGDVAAISVREATEDDPGRRLAVLDIGEFNAEDTRAELDDAELTVLGILRNKNGEMNGATDLRLSDDGNYAFLGTQSLTPGGRSGTRDGRDARSGAETTGGVVAVDISDPENPETVGSLTEPFSTGSTTSSTTASTAGITSSPARTPASSRPTAACTSSSSTGTPASSRSSTAGRRTATRPAARSAPNTASRTSTTST